MYCHTLQHQLRTFKRVWVTNKPLLPSLRCYADGPAQWVDEVLAANKATKKRPSTSKVKYWSAAFQNKKK